LKRSNGAEVKSEQGQAVEQSRMRLFNRLDYKLINRQQRTLAPCCVEEEEVDGDKLQVRIVNAGVRSKVIA